jgi:vesicle coat complex subunit
MVREDLLSQDPDRQITAIKQVIAFMTIGKDMSSHFNDVANLVSHPNLAIKKLVYLYLMQNSKSQPEKAVLQAGTFVHDTLHESPLIRGIALRTMSSMLVPSMVDFMHGPILRCLRDADPYVRRAAAFASLKLFSIAPNVCEETGILEVLPELLADPIATVVSAVVAVVRELLLLNAPTKLATTVMQRSSTLLAAMGDCTDWSQMYLLDGLALIFQQKLPVLSAPEAEVVVTRILPLLSSSNPAVVLASLKVMLLFMSQFIGPTSSPLTPVQQQQLEARFAPKIVPPLISMVTNVRFEIRYVALRSIKLVLQTRFREALCPYISSFYAKFDDPIYIKLEKLDILISLANRVNGEQVLTELVEYATEIDIELVRKSVRLIGTLAVKVEPLAAQCVENLVELLAKKVNYIVQESAVVVQTILRQYPNRFEGVISTLCQSLDVIDDGDSKAAVAWVVGQYADRVENAADILSLFFDGFMEEPLKVQLTVLTAVVKTYLKAVESAPGKNQAALERVLALATASASPDLRDRAYFYWRLISTDPASAHKIILADKQELVDTPVIDKQLLSELLSQLGCASAVLHKPAGTLFATDRGSVYYDDSDEEPAAPPAADRFVPDGGPTIATIKAEVEIAQQQQPNVLDSLDFTTPTTTSSQSLPASSSAPSQLNYACVLTAQQGKGLEVNMAWTQSSSMPILNVRFQLQRSEHTVSQIKISLLQLNVNQFGLGIAQEFPEVTVKAGGEPASVTLLVNCNNRKQPVKAIQVAVQTDPTGVLFFVAPPVPTAMLLLPATGYDAMQYVTEFKALAPAWSYPANSPRVITSAARTHGNTLRLQSFNLLHTKEVPPLLGLHLFAETIAGQKLYFEVTVENWVVVLLTVRTADDSIAAEFGEYLAKCLQA